MVENRGAVTFFVENFEKNKHEGGECRKVDNIFCFFIFFFDGNEKKVVFD